MIRNILALDLATVFGHAKIHDGVITSGRYRLPSTGEDVGKFLAAYEDTLLLFGSGELDLIIFEAPWIGPQTSQDTARKLLCLAGETEKFAYRRGITCREENNATIRKHFIGKGSGIPREEMKRRTIEACRARGWNPVDDNVADALALLDYAMSVYNVPGVKSGPLFGATA